MNEGAVLDIPACEYLSTLLTSWIRTLLIYPHSFDLKLSLNPKPPVNSSSIGPTWDHLTLRLFISFYWGLLC